MRLSEHLVKALECKQHGIAENLHNRCMDNDSEFVNVLGLWYAYSQCIETKLQNHPIQFNTAGLLQLAKKKGPGKISLYVVTSI